MDTIKSVEIFMKTAGQTVYEKPTQPTLEVLKLRISLELEELYELAQAFGLEGTFQRMLRRNLQDVRSGGYHNIADVTGFPYAADTHDYNAVEVLDAAVDQRYVQDGTVLACGLQDVFAEAFANVQASNMSKFCALDTVTVRTEAHYAALGIVTTTVTHDNNGRSPWYGVVKRASDGKILKSIDYIPASLGPILDKHTAR